MSPRRSPIVTGSSVIAIKYADGVMVAADTLGAGVWEGGGGKGRLA
jgi:20S proteasome alpha/beta subunit